MYFKKIISCIILSVLIFNISACTKKPQGEISIPSTYGKDWLDEYDATYTDSLLSKGEQEFTMSQLSGKDSNGNSVLPSGRKTEGRYVGVFYFMWHNEADSLYDISKILDKYSDQYSIYDTVKNPLWANIGSEYYKGDVSPQNALHYFEEPLYGYYTSKDKWVIKRHLELLTFAGIDFLYLDFTNAYFNSDKNVCYNIYPEATYALMDSILELQQQGFSVPKIVPLVCNPTIKLSKVRAETVQWVYNNYYKKDNYKYKNCWFFADNYNNPEQKPLIVSYNLERETFTDKKAYDDFWIRDIVWPTEVSQTSYENGFPWMDYSYPQDVYDGIMNVSVAQHLDGNWSSEAFLAKSHEIFDYRYRSRSATGSQTKACECDDVEKANYGANFVEQWANVLTYKDDNEIWMVTVTGWNEWVAQKLNLNNLYASFVDTFNTAFSRDIEMMRDKEGYADNYYMLLVKNIQDFKSQTNSYKSKSAMWQKQTIKYDDINAWNDVKAKYIDFVSDAMNRNEKSVGGNYQYTDNSARNDIEYLKVANDEEYLYLLVKTKDNISQYCNNDDNWMNVYISNNKEKGWENYNYIINRFPVLSENETSIERLSTENNKIKTETLSSKANVFVDGKFISYRISLKSLGLSSSDEIQLKICDNNFAVQSNEANDGVGAYKFGDINGFYCGGDCAPIGRINYSYRMAY